MNTAAKKLKIGIVHFNLAPLMGDTRCVPSFARALIKMGHDVKIYTTTLNKEAFPELWKGLNIEVVRQNKDVNELIKGGSFFKKAFNKIRLNAWSLRAAEELSKVIDPDLDILDCHNDYSYKVGFFYKKINHKARIVWTMHDPPFTYRPKGGKLLNLISRLPLYLEPFYEKKFFSAADGVLVADERNLEMVRKMGLRGEIVHMGLDYGYFFHKAEKKKRGKTVKLLSVGSLSPYRRFEDTVLAAKELRKKGYDASAVIIGKDFWEDRKYRASFEDLVKKSGMAEHSEIKFDGIGEDELLKAYRDADIFVFPNHVEIWGMAPFEAMAGGLPLIVSNITSVAEVMTDGDNALFVDPLRPDQIADKAGILMRDEKFYEKIAVNGQKFTKENVNWDVYAEGFMKIAYGK